MEYEITFHDDYVVIRAWGRASLQGFIDYTREGLESPEWRPGMNVLVDLRELEGHDTENISFDDSSRYASFVIQNKALIGDGKTAIVAAKDLDSKVLISMYDSLTKYYGKGAIRKNRIFDDSSQAAAWLLKEE